MPQAEFDCPHCTKTVRAEVQTGADRARCPACGGVVLLDKAVPRSAASVRYVDEPAAEAPAVETDVALAGPTWRSYPWWLLLGILLAPVGIGLIILAWIWVEVKSLKYRLTTQRLFITRGLISRKVDEVELFRVKDVTLSQGVLERLLGIGTVTILSTDDGTPELRMEGIADPAKMKDAIREHCLAARRRERVRSTEFIES
jgi:membrane protein YdbS with pleckstrin-like domain/DNA-directed RNA polymerase subunit RPC12/RpoP